MRTENLGSEDKLKVKIKPSSWFNIDVSINTIRYSNKTQLKDKETVLMSA